MKGVVLEKPGPLENLVLKTDLPIPTPKRGACTHSHSLISSSIVSGRNTK
jgi:hypothetical protein